VVVARRDGLGPDDLRVLAQAVLGRDGVKASAIGGAAGERVAIVVATGGTPDAGALVKQIGPLIGGSGGGKPDLATAGGRDATRLDEALAAARTALQSA
jgi:alanyl-tRNA synthetase